MNEAKYLIIGGGIAGTTAAETLREQDSNARVILVTDEPHPLYSKVLLSKPNFFLEKIPFDKIWLKKPDWYTERRIEFLSGKKAVKLDPVNKVVTLNSNEEIKYDKLLLAIGGEPRKISVPGAEKQGIFYLRTVEDGKAISEAAKKAQSAIVIGGGIIGFEMSEMLRSAGLETTFVLRSEHYRDTLLGLDCSLLVEEKMRTNGVKLLCGYEITEILGADRVSGVKMMNSLEVDCQIIVVGIGTTVPFEWIRAAGVQCNMGILANEYLETSVPDIYAAGDVAEFQDIIIGDRVIYGNWANAQKQGERAALNMTGKREPFRAVTFFQTHGFGLVMTYVGDVRPAADREVIQRGHEGDTIQERFFLKHDRLMGALLFNAPQHLGICTKLIEQQVDLKSYKEKLTDAHWELENIIK